MKLVRSLSLLVSFIFCVAAPAQEIRYVGNIPVDLAPLFKWLRTREGERPLAHWKQVKINTVNVGLDAWPKCAITVDDETRTVFLANVPKPAIAVFGEVVKLDTEIKQLDSYVAAERIRVRDMRANAPSEAYAGTRGYEQIRQVNVATSNLETSTERLDELKLKLATAKATVSTLSRELAMFTGRKYAGLEIWDCGQKR